MAKELYVDSTECTGCEYCVDGLLAVFRMNDDGISEVHDHEGAPEEDIQHIMDNCPAECIHWK